MVTEKGKKFKPWRVRCW